ncbi:hypothetical protein [Donghicola eburneus]|uniref:Secreted protein n=1 Tax=Donghicola eburneus TaxID=393278 RepID=A0A1M4N1Q1_9RHOB|nr:hypothetical protein [Donghicola eburneus]SCM68782.1 hypothetical protein KARMA_3012 [Donghicola eburneus]SFQ41585.1 hypothetical protein SAMN05421764_103443 [Donghicola eburneus]
MRGISVCLAAWLAGPVCADGLDLSEPAPLQAPALGLAFPGNQPQFYDLLRDAGMSWARISASWRRIGREDGSLSFADLDRRVAGLQAVGVHPFVTFESDADWATDPATHRVKNATPTDMTAWAAFITAVVERYDGDGHADMPGLRAPVRMWQAANEYVSDTNASGGWAGSNADLLIYVNAAHDAVKAADPAAQFVLGGTAAFVMDVALVNQGYADWTVRQFWQDGSELVYAPDKSRGAEVTALVEDRLKFILENARYDIADIHLYGPEERDGDRIAALTAWSGGKPFLSSECGGPNLDYGDSYSPQAHFMAVIERNLNVLAEGGSACLWFGLGEEMVTTTGNARVPLYDMDRQPKPGVYAYRLLSRLLPKGASVRQIAGGWQIDGPEGEQVQIFRKGGAADSEITHCVPEVRLDRVLKATNNVNCANSILVFKGDLGRDILNE